MHFLKITGKFIYRHSSALLLLGLIVFSFDRCNRLKDWHDTRGPFISDVQEYYAYLPQHFIQNQTPALIIDSLGQNILPNKRTIGMALLYSPFFLAGHTQAILRGAVTNGYSYPYQQWIHIGSIVYTLLGLFFSRKTLLYYFNDLTVSISLAGIFLGSNLFYYTYGNGEMPHSYLFFLFSVYIYCFLSFVQNRHRAYLYWSALLLGLITLIRPTDFLLILFSLFCSKLYVDSKGEKIRLTSLNIKQALVCLILFAIPLVLQFAYWKYYFSRWIVYTYNRERFFFTDPQLLNFLFSYRKGWFLYSPVMLFACIGLLCCTRYIKHLLWPVVLSVAATVYVLSCWWDWSFGGSFGCRAMVEWYAVLLFPFAALIDWCLHHAFTEKTYRILLSTTIGIVLYGCIELNFFQHMQYKYGIMHYSGMTKELYWKIFLNSNLTAKNLKDNDLLVKEPNVNDQLKGIRDE